MVALYHDQHSALGKALPNLAERKKRAERLCFTRSMNVWLFKQVNSVSFASEHGQCLKKLSEVNVTSHQRNVNVFSLHGSEKKSDTLVNCVD